MARCHRIGQDKDVTIYRLVSKDTYEEHVFRTSSRKYGLDEAILGGIAGGGGDSGSNGGDELDGKKIAELLKHGAHCLDKVEEANAETDAFASEDIDQILSGRTEKRQIGGRAGNTFSVATFAVETEGNATAGDDKTFWSALLPEAVAAHAEEKKIAKYGHIMLAPRQRKRVNYKEAIGKKRRGSGSSSASEADAGDADYDADEGNDSKGGGSSTGGNVGRPPKQQKGRDGSGVAISSDAEPKKWSGKCAHSFFDQLLKFGFSENGVKKAAETARVLNKGYPAEDIPAVAASLHAMLKAALTAAPGRPARLGVMQHSVSRHRDAIMSSLRKEHNGLIPDEILLGVAAQAEARAKAEVEAIKAQALQWDQTVAAAVGTLAITAAGDLIPKTALKALQDGKLGDKMIRSAPLYLDHLREVELLAAWGDSGNPAPPMIHRAGFPHWWSRSEDTKLMKGVYTLGWPLRRHADVVQSILVHPEFGFAEKIVEATPAEAAQGVAEINAGGAVAATGPFGGTVVVAQGQNNNTTGMSGVIGMDEDSFQVRPSPGSTRDAPLAAAPGQQLDAGVPGGVTVATPFALAAGGGNAMNAPRVLSPTEWGRLRDVLVKQIKNIFMYWQAKKNAMEKNAANQSQAQTNQAAAAGEGTSAAAATATLATALQRMESGRQASGEYIDLAATTDTSDFTLGLTRTSSLDSNVSSGSEANNGNKNGSGGDGTTKAASRLLQEVLRREAIKQLGGDRTGGNGAAAAGGGVGPSASALSKHQIAAALEKRRESNTAVAPRQPAAAAATPAAMPAVVEESVEEDPIELFTDDEDDFKQTSVKGATAAAGGGSKAAVGAHGATVGKKHVATPGPEAPNTTVTPGSGTIPALNVFKETRGDFTAPQTVVGGGPGSSSAKAGAASGSGLGAASGGIKKKNMRRSKASLVGGQQSLLEMPKVQKFLTKVKPTNGEEEENIEQV